MKPKKSWAGNILVPLMVAGLNAAVILFPRESLEAAKGGLTLWLNNVLPSLLPFAAGVNILTGLGVVRFIGALLEPVTRSVFRVPGSGGVAVAAGFMSGYPMGAKITAELRADGSLTAAQAQRLISFSNTSGPLFIIGAVGAGMFGDPLAGYLLYTAQILGALTVGLCFRFYKSKEEPPRDTRKKKLLTHAFDEMSRARGVKGFGEVLGSSVMKAMETMLLVGGFIILFSVVTRILGELRVFSLA
ncbi:MAG: sporulation integral membrane protein YlbJ, partial [Clostridiales bacterium]|nr:sporulation integral membrane protein YlbJ [Clostridiales bacterium]